MTEKFLEFLGLPAEAGADDIMAKLTSCQAAAACVQDLGQLLGVEANAAVVKDAVLALHEAGEVAVRLREELDQLKQAWHKEKAGEAVERALKAGKIKPSGRERARRLAETDLAGFEELMAVVAESQPEAAVAGDPESPASGMETDLSPAELLMAETLWITPEQFKASRDEMLRSGRLKIGAKADQGTARRKGEAEVVR